MKTAGLSPSEIAANRREYSRLYAKKKRQDPKHRERRNGHSRTYYQSLSPEKKKAYGRRVNLWKYGLSETDYDELLESQHGVCAICGTGPNGENLAVDHCHESGKVRGLLCQSCNTGLGRFRDNTDFLANAIEYLKQS